MANEFAIKDYRKLIDKFEKLSEALQKKHAWGAARKGAQVIANAAKANAAALDDPETANSIARNITVQKASKIAKREKAAAYRIGVAGGAISKSQNETNPGGDTWYWRFIELGTEKMPARPFLRPAAESSGQAVVSAIVDSLSKRIAKEAEK